MPARVQGAAPVDAPSVQVAGFDLQRLMSQWDTKLQEYPAMSKAADAVGIRPSILFAALALFLVLSLGFGWGGGIVCDLTGFLYPGKEVFCVLG